MRIMYITDALAVWGGIERVLRDKMNYLVEHYGYDVHIVTTDQGDHSVPYPLDRRVIVHDLDISFHHQYKLHGFSRLIEYWKLNRLFYYRLKELISIVKPEVIICIRLEMINSILKAKGSIPLLCESHSLCYAYKFEKASVWYRMRFQMVLKRISKVSCVITLTEGDANDWRKYNENVVVIPNIVQLNSSDKYSDLESKSIIFVGRFSDQKDVWSLFKIWKIVHQRYPEWELHTYGEGEYKEDFVKAADKADIGIKAFPPTSEIFDRYLNSSMLIMTSRYEPFGLVLTEAMSCGLPVVAFNCPYGPADIISDGIDGFLIEGRNVGQFANRICDLIEDRSLRHNIGKAAILSSQRFSKERIMPLWKDLFMRIK